MDIPNQRLLNLHIALPVFKKPEDEVAWLGAVQSQDYAGAKWALGLRLRGALEADIEQAFTDGRILRTHMLRPTWHFVTPADIRWILALTAPRVSAASATYFRRLEMDAAFFSRSNAALVKALQGGQQPTREELRAALQTAGIVTEGEQRMGYIMMQAELDGVVCSGARRGKQFTYALLEERVPPARALAPEEALAELTRRYFFSRGPATLQDYMKWSGLTAVYARRGLESVKSLLAQEGIEGKTYWFPPADPPADPPDQANGPRVYLLSVFDEYISGYKDHSTIVDPQQLERLISQGNFLGYIIVLDGQIVGTWKRAFRKGTVAIEINLFTALTPAQNQAMVEAAQHYGEFLGRSVVMG
jgi:hypothetical protein